MLRALRHLKSVMPQVGLRFSSVVVGAASGENNAVDFSGFVSEGCTVSAAGNVEILKSPVGSLSDCVEFSSRIGEKQSEIVSQLAKINNPQLVYYLLRWSCDASRMSHLSRTTPLEACKAGLGKFDATCQQTWAAVTGLPLSSSQHIQCSFNV